MKKIIFKGFVVLLAVVNTTTQSYQLSPSHCLQKMCNSTPVLYFTHYKNMLMQKPCVKTTILQTQNFASAACQWQTYRNFVFTHSKKTIFIGGSCIVGAYGTYKLFNCWQVYKQALQEKQARADALEIIKQNYTYVVKRNIDQWTQNHQLEKLSDEKFNELIVQTKSVFIKQIKFKKETRNKLQEEVSSSALNCMVQDSNAKKEHIFTLKELETNSAKILRESIFKGRALEGLRNIISQIS